MKIHTLWAALCCLIPLSTHAALFGVVGQTPVPGPVSLTAVTASPTTLSALVKGSYLYMPASQPGSQVATFTISGSWSATLHAYVVGADGNTLSLADNLVYNLTGGSYGAVASGAGGSYFLNVPSGGFCLVQTAVTSAPTCSVGMGPGVLFTPTGAALSGAAYSNGSTVFSSFASSSAGQSASTSWATLSTYTTSALGYRRSVIVFNPPTNTVDVVIGTTSGSGVWDVPPGSTVYVPAATGVTLYYGTVTGSATGIIATEAA